MWKFLRRVIKMFIWIIGILIILGTLVLAVSRIITGAAARGKIYTSADVPVHRIAIVFGAGLWRNGTPTPVLEDRVKTAADLYFTGKVEKLLFSGDNRFVEYNEPEAMRQLALKLGVPSEAIVRDYAGRRTYDTCYRAGAIFGVNEAILVTQAFHMPRALYLCNHLGVKAVGVNSDIQKFRKSVVLYWNMRELIATAAALWDIHIAHPLPVLGNREPIFP
jgi:SanA protein